LKPGDTAVGNADIARVKALSSVISVNTPTIPPSGPPFADLGPHAATAPLFEGARGIAVALEPLGDPGRELARSRGHDARSGRCAQNGLVSRPRLDL
jgi:hypothetical protein